jgi:hypothetical protein
MNESNQRELVDFLGEIDKRLAKQWPGQIVELYVFGGAAAVVAYAAKRATVDLDVYLENKEIEGKLLEWGGHGSQLEKKYGVYLESANTSLMLIEDPEWRERSVEIMHGKFKSMRLMAVSKEDLILSKLSRYNDRDRADIQHLIETCKADAEKLVSYYKSARQYYVGYLGTLDATFNIVLKEHFNLGPIAF